MYNLIELYFRKSDLSFSDLVYKKYSYFVKKISDTKPTPRQRNFIYGI